MIGTNMNETGWLKGQFNGKYSDFDADWYPDIGLNIATTMTFFAIQPAIDCIVGFITLWVSRKAIRTFVNKGDAAAEHRDYLTFVEMNCGPPYQFDQQVSKTCIVYCTCLCLGPCIPVMYLVGAIALFI